MSRTSDAKGYTYFSTYRAHSLWYNGADDVEYAFTGTRSDSNPPTFTVFDHSFNAIRKQLDEICHAR